MFIALSMYHQALTVHDTRHPIYLHSTHHNLYTDYHPRGSARYYHAIDASHAKIMKGQEPTKTSVRRLLRCRCLDKLCLLNSNLASITDPSVV
jgi:hypothetical protein